VRPTPVQLTTAAKNLAIGTWFDPRRGEECKDAIATLAKHSVVLLGETHTEPDHHRWQVRTIEALFGLRPEMVLGFEMFPRRVQPVLDRWSRGELNETAFLGEVDWPQIWGFDSQLYMPLFELARKHRLPMVALNVDRATVRRVGMQGVASTPQVDRENVGDPAPASPRYRECLFGWFKNHPAGREGAAENSAMFEGFVRAQSFWDRAMAEAIAGACRDRPGALAVGIMGRGHIEYGDGVQRQLAAVGIDNVATALPWPVGTECPRHDPPIADFLFGVAPAEDREPPVNEG
jgi:uncharacterized iron-regulated protein